MFCSRTVLDNQGVKKSPHSTCGDFFLSIVSNVIKEHILITS
jgi:hypothetical protein